VRPILPVNLQPQSAYDFPIREANAGDVREVVRLIQQLASESGEHSPITPSYVAAYLEDTRSTVLLAEHHGAVAGLLSYSVRPDLYHAGNSILIEELVVDERWRSVGLGSALITALLEKVEDLDAREACLAVMPDNERAIRFYRSHGWAEEALFLERHFPAASETRSN
jgi:ribosomal-protein-alanine N-acetyltransferase